VNARELANLLRRDTDPAVAHWIAWAEKRGRGEELRLTAPLIDAGFVELDGGELRLTLLGRTAVHEMLAVREAVAA